MDTTNLKAEVALYKMGGGHKIDPLTIFLVVKIILFIISVFLKWKFNGNEMLDYLKKSKGIFGFLKRRAIKKAMESSGISEIDVYLPFVIDTLSESTVSELNNMGRRAQLEGYHNG